MILTLPCSPDVSFAPPIHSRPLGSFSFTKIFSNMRSHMNLVVLVLVALTVSPTFSAPASYGHGNLAFHAPNSIPFPPIKDPPNVPRLEEDRNQVGPSKSASAVSSDSSFTNHEDPPPSTGAYPPPSRPQPSGLQPSGHGRILQYGKWLDNPYAALASFAIPIGSGLVAAILLTHTHNRNQTNFTSIAPEGSVTG